MCVHLASMLFSVAIGGVCRISAFGNIELREGDFESRLVSGGDQCQVYTCKVREKHINCSTVHTDQSKILIKPIVLYSL